MGSIWENDQPLLLKAVDQVLFLQVPVRKKRQCTCIDHKSMSLDLRIRE